MVSIYIYNTLLFFIARDHSVRFSCSSLSRLLHITPEELNKMQFTTILLTAIWPLALAIPTPSSHQPDRLQKRFQEAIPWELSNIAVFNAALGPSGVSLISFHFCDTNTGIELETECSREMAPGSGQSVIDPDNYYPCNNSTVSFAYTGTALFIHRSYIDPA